MQDYDYFLVLDFEATCDDGKRIPFNEIIEFPTCAVNANTREIEFEFHQYVKPTSYPGLTEFCTKLTGIRQEWVDEAKCLGEVLEDYQKWLETTGLIEKRIVWMTCGDWDLKKMLPSQCSRENIQLPCWVEKFGYINIKKSFCDHFKVEARGMANMLRILNIKLEGRHHSGIDDSRNTAKILLRMIEEGYRITTVFHDTSITGQYVQVGEGLGSVAVSSWFPNQAHIRKYGELYDPPTMIVTCMNKRDGSRKVDKFMKKIKDITHLPVTYGGANLLIHKELIKEIKIVADHLKNSLSKVIVVCQNGWSKSTIFLFLVLREIGVEMEEAIRILKFSRYRSIEKFSDEKIQECEDFVEKTKN